MLIINAVDNILVNANITSVNNLNNNKNNDNMIKALANSVRLQLLLCIGDKSKSVTELINNCGLSQSAVSQHLTKLKDSGLVEDKKDGRVIKYSVKDKKVLDISKQLLNLQNKNDK